MPKRKTPKTPASPKAVATPDPTTPGPVVPSGLKASGPATPSQRPLGPVVAEPFKDIPERPATHDAMFRVLAKTRAAALLWTYLPEKYRRLVDFDKEPVIVDGNQHDESLRLSQCDVLLEVALKRWIKTPEGRRQDFAHVLFEHKSWVDHATALQLEGYRLGVLKDYAAKHPDRLRSLPLFIPMVFYNGSRKWNAPTSLGRMFAHQDVVGPEMHGLEYIPVDLGEMPPEDLAEDPVARAVLIAMRFATREREGEPYFTGIVKDLEGEERLQRQTKFYMMRQWASPMETLIALEEALSRETGGERIMQSCGDMLIAQGEAQGEIKGMANMVIAQMRHRFNGRVSERDEARVAQGSAEELGLWGERLLTADSPETVFDPGSQRRH